jgi:hypothetical protein
MAEANTDFGRIPFGTVAVLEPVALRGEIDGAAEVLGKAKGKIEEAAHYHKMAEEVYKCWYGGQRGSADWAKEAAGKVATDSATEAKTLADEAEAVRDKMARELAWEKREAAELPEMTLEEAVAEYKASVEAAKEQQKMAQQFVFIESMVYDSNMNIADWDLDGLIALYELKEKQANKPMSVADMFLPHDNIGELADTIKEAFPNLGQDFNYRGFAAYVDQYYGTSRLQMNWGEVEAYGLEKKWQEIQALLHYMQFQAAGAIGKSSGVPKVEEYPQITDPQTKAEWQEYNSEYYRGSEPNVVYEDAGRNLPKTSAESVKAKLDTYLLEPTHPKGGSKAKWFEQALGFNKTNAGALEEQIIFDLDKAIQTSTNEFGTKYSQIIPITGINGRVIDVEFIWIRNNDGIARLVTGIPTKR